MKWLAHQIMARRAGGLLRRIERHLPQCGVIADFGSGTGHNSEAIRRATQLVVQDFDIADLHWVGPGPILFQGASLPAHAKSFDAALLLFVLHYPQSPRELLAEVRRVTRGSVIVIQSTYRGGLGRKVLAVRECLWGRLAFRLAVLTRAARKAKCPLTPRQFFTRNEAQQLFLSVGFEILAFEPAEWIGLNVSRDLFVLRAVEQ